MPAAHKLHKPSLRGNHGAPLMGNIFPDGRIYLPVQDFLSGKRANDIIDNKLSTIKGKNDGLQSRYVSYLLESVSPSSKIDIVEKLQRAHI